MPDKIFGNDRPPGLFPKRRFKDHGDGSYSERVIAQTDSGEPATQATLVAILAQLDITLSSLRDALRGASTKDFTTVEADVEASKAVLDLIKAKTDNLDLAITALRDALRGASSKDFTTLEADLEAVLAKLDVALSTRALESGGNLQTLAGKDFATQTTLAAVLGQLDITLSSLRDALKGSSSKDFSTLETDVESILAKMTKWNQAVGALDDPGDVSIPYNQETQFKSYSGESWLYGIVFRLDKSGTPNNLGRDKVRLRIYRDGGQLYEYNLARLVDIVYGQNTPEDDHIIVHKDDVGNNSMSMTVNFPRGIYCGTSFAIKFNNTSTDAADNYTVKGVVKYAKAD